MSREFLRRIRKASALGKVVPNAVELVHHGKCPSGEPLFRHGQSMGWSGLGSCGYPKAVPLALAKYCYDLARQGGMPEGFSPIQFDLYTGASVGTEIEEKIALAGMVRRRWPFVFGKNMARAINKGDIMMGDAHLSLYAQQLQYGFFANERKRTMMEIKSLIEMRDRERMLRESAEGTHHAAFASDALMRYDDAGTYAELSRTKDWVMPSGRSSQHFAGDSVPKAGDVEDYEYRHTMDIAVIEATDILPNGGVIPSAAIGVAQEITSKARHVIIELNTTIPSLRGFHDIVPDAVPPKRQPLNINRADDRIGEEYLMFDFDKVVAIVESKHADSGLQFKDTNEVSQKISGHLMDFFLNEVHHGRLPSSLLPIQSGVGSIANAVIGGLVEGPFYDITCWSEAFQDTMLDFMDSGKLTLASTASLSLSKEGFVRLFDLLDHYRHKIIVRPQQITNNPEIIRRLGVISMNTPIEVDIYAHANSTLVQGSRMVHGIGGSGDFLRSGYISIVHTPSVRPTKVDPTGISCIVPRVSHTDHTEHDLDIVVTEQGLADVRGMGPRSRARTIIERCSHPDYKDMLMDYFLTSERHCLANESAHEPHLLGRMFEMHVNLERYGTMKGDTLQIDPDNNNNNNKDKDKDKGKDKDKDMVNGNDKEKDDDDDDDDGHGHGHGHRFVNTEHFIF